MSASCNTSQCRYQLAKSEMLSRSAGRIYGRSIYLVAHTCTRRDAFWIQRAGKSIDSGREGKSEAGVGEGNGESFERDIRRLFIRINRSGRPKAITARNVGQSARSVVCLLRGNIIISDIRDKTGIISRRINRFKLYFRPEFLASLMTRGGREREKRYNFYVYFPNIPVIGYSEQWDAVMTFLSHNCDCLPLHPELLIQT